MPPAVPPPLPVRAGVRSVLFSIVVGVGLVLGALVMAVVLLASGHPGAIALGLVLAAVPVGPVIACYLWLDRFEPEPTRLLVLAFGWGALVATTGALLLQAIDVVVNDSSETWSALVTAPLTEEAGKGAFVLLLLWSRRQVIDGLVDGLVYAGLVGVGFAFTENILYFAGAYTGGPDFGNGGLGSTTVLFVLRGIFSPFAHPLFTSMTGIGVAIMVTTRHRSVRWLAPILGYVAAVALHAAWNASAFLFDGQYFLLTYVFAMVPGFFTVVGVAVWARVRERRLFTASLTDLARLGYLRTQEVPWLVALPARRAMRRDAVRRGGSTGERLVRDYQAQAIALAALHSRVLRGTAPRDYVQRGGRMAGRLAILRAHLDMLWAPPPIPQPLATA